MSQPYRIVGYAIVSSDGNIADSRGLFPDALIIPEDKQVFERELNGADVVVQGRNSYEHQRNSPLRRRMVLTQKIAATAPDPDNANGVLWNPAGASFAQACAALGLTGGLAAIIGGTRVFDLFLGGVGYDAFFLTRAQKVSVPGGLPLFSGVAPGGSPEDVLTQSGLAPGPEQVLDAAGAVRMVEWRRKAPA